MTIHDDIDDDRDVITDGRRDCARMDIVAADLAARGFDGTVKDGAGNERTVTPSLKPSIEAAIKATANGDAEATIAAKAKHVEAGGFFRRSWEGVKTWGIELKAKWGGK